MEWKVLYFPSCCVRWWRVGGGKKGDEWNRVKEELHWKHSFIYYWEREMTCTQHWTSGRENCRHRWLCVFFTVYFRILLVPIASGKGKLQPSGPEWDRSQEIDFHLTPLTPYLPSTHHRGPMHSGDLTPADARILLSDILILDSLISVKWWLVNLISLSNC